MAFLGTQPRCSVLCPSLNVFRDTILYYITGNAAQERYRMHRRKPVFSHEGLVLSLLDLLSKRTYEGAHTSGELYR